MTTVAVIPLAIPCDGCGAAAGEPCDPFCIGLAAEQDRERDDLIDHLIEWHWHTPRGWLEQQTTQALLDLHDRDHDEPDPDHGREDDRWENLR